MLRINDIFNFEEESFTMTIVGKLGQGKTTLMKYLAYLFSLEDNKVYFNSLNWENNIFDDKFDKITKAKHSLREMIHHVGLYDYDVIFIDDLYSFLTMDSHRSFISFIKYCRIYGKKIIISNFKSNRISGFGAVQTLGGPMYLFHDSSYIFNISEVSLNYDLFTFKLEVIKDIYENVLLSNPIEIDVKYYTNKEPKSCIVFGDRIITL